MAAFVAAVPPKLSSQADQLTVAEAVLSVPRARRAGPGKSLSVGAARFCGRLDGSLHWVANMRRKFFGVHSFTAEFLPDPSFGRLANQPASPGMSPVASSQGRSILVADIGGTNCRLQLASATEDRVIFSRTYSNKLYDSLVDIIKEFLAEAGNASPASACLAVAGPVEDDKCLLTNVEWKVEKAIDGRDLEKRLSIPAVRLINDFVANGYGLPALTPEDVVVLQAGEKKEGGAIGCIGAGTGLGVVFLTHDGSKYHAQGSEGGHTEFGPRNALQDGLLKFMREKLGADDAHVSVERLVSGAGLRDIYSYLSTVFPEKVDKQTHGEIQGAEDASPIISIKGGKGEDALCEMAVKMFMEIYGAEAGNKALTLIPRGGMFIAGGIAPKNLAAMQKDNVFMKSFLDKGRLRGVVEKVPVCVVTHPDLGLLGARTHARTLL
eukprot:tig00000615_g2610.t1